MRLFPLRRLPTNLKRYPLSEDDIALGQMIQAMPHIWPCHRDNPDDPIATNIASPCFWCSSTLLHLPIPYFCYPLASVFPELKHGHASWLM